MRLWAPLRKLTALPRPYIRNWGSGIGKGECKGLGRKRKRKAKEKKGMERIKGEKEGREQGLFSFTCPQWRFQGKYLWAWPLIIWEAATAERNYYYRTN